MIIKDKTAIAWVKNWESLNQNIFITSKIYIKKIDSNKIRVIKCLQQ